MRRKKYYGLLKKGSKRKIQDVFLGWRPSIASSICDFRERFAQKASQGSRQFSSSVTTRLICGLFSSCFLSSAYASTWYVNAKYGNDSYSGLKTTQSFKTINKACSVVEPGDTVILASGVYFENVNLWKLGTAGRPITFKGETRAKEAVTITGADPD